MGSAALALFLSGLVTGCVPDRPSGDAWVEECQRQTDTVASSIAAGEKVVRLAGDDRILGHYARVVLVQAEESADKAVSSVGALQPPRNSQASSSEVISLLDKGIDALRTTRIALVNDPDLDSGQVRELRDELRASHRDLTGKASDLCAQAVGP